MKRVLITFILLLSINLASFAQPYFQGSFSLGTNDTVVFKMKPVFGNITTTISYMEFAFKYITTQAPGLSTSAPVSNTAFFGSGLSVAQFPPDYVDGNFTYIKFIHNTATLASKKIAINEVFKNEVIFFYFNSLTDFGLYDVKNLNKITAITRLVS